MISKRYRPEIDGLRAVAVVGVILFHFGLNFPGGFVGVDVFFVISGFLITGILHRQITNGNFSLKDFSSRRIKRILPAASLMVVFSLLVGYFVLSPLGLTQLADTARMQSLVAANFHFAGQSGYFEESADFKPLLHTWSLAVEEQFYIIFPFVLLLLCKYVKRHICWILLGLALASFLFSLSILENAPKQAFFLLPSRAWELLAGGLIAIFHRTSMPRKIAEVSSAIGLLGILLPMFIYTKHTIFPGCAALLPVLSTCLFIISNRSHLTITGKILAIKPITFIGLISYSLYLWHWPLMVFANHTLIEVTVGGKLTMISASIVLAILSWRFIETPFRQGFLLKNDRRTFSFAALSIITFVGVGGWIINQDGLENRVSKTQQLLHEDIDWRGDEFAGENGAAIEIGDLSQKDIHFVLWGDSHAMAAAETISNTARNHQQKGIAYLAAGTPPIPGVFYQESDSEEQQQFLEQSTLILNSIIDKKIPHVILVGRWVARCDGYNKAECKNKPTDYQSLPMLIEHSDQLPTPESSSKVLTKHLTIMLTKLHEAGTRVWLMQQVPESNSIHTAKHVSLLKTFPNLNRLPQYTTTLKEHQHRQKNTNLALGRIPSHLVSILDPTSYFFNESTQLKVYDKRSFYRDDDHLTRHGAKHYLTPLFHDLFIQIKQSPPQPNRNNGK